MNSKQLTPAPKLPRNWGNRSAFTILEALAVVAIVGVTLSVAYMATSSTAERASEVKLRSDVATLNRAVQVYLANGGDVESAADAQDILSRLKSVLNSEDADRFVGMTSSFGDLRIKAIYQDAEEALTDQLRSTWDHEKKRFILGNAGDAAIKQFVFDETQSGVENEVEERDHSGFMYALEDEWIWDFEDRPQGAPTEVTTVSIYFDFFDEVFIAPVVNPYDIPDEGPSDPGVDPDPDSKPMLLPPTFDPEGTKYLYSSFPLEIVLENPNPDSTSVIRYAINEGSYQTYSGPFTVMHDETVRAYCATRVPDVYRNSPEASEHYESVEELFAGQANGWWSSGHQNGEEPAGYGNNGHGNNYDGVDSSNPGASGGDDPSGDYDDEMHQNGSGPPRYETSAVVSYTNDGHFDKFEWGTSANSGPPSNLRFQGSTIVNVEPEQLFRVGHLHYYNGTIYSGTGADAVNLNVDLDLTTPDRDESFSFEFELENTVNHGNDPDEDADYVRINGRVLPMAAPLNGKLYYLVLEFGDVTEHGFSSVNQFHVHENKSAMTSLYGYFTENPPYGTETHDDRGTGEGNVSRNVIVTDGAAEEGGVLHFSAVLSSPSATDTVITYSTVDGTANSSAGDFVPQLNRSVTIPAGRTSTILSVVTADDQLVERDETLSISYTIEGQGITEPNGTANGTIINNDSATLIVANSEGVEGDTLTFNVTLDKQVDTDVNVVYSTTSGSAEASDHDFVIADSESVVIPAGQTQTTISVVTNEDNKVESEEWFHVHYYGEAAGRSISGTGYAALGTIENDDEAILTVADASAEESEALEFVVSLSNPVDHDLDVTYSTADGTARWSDSDYDAQHNRTHTIRAGDTTDEIRIRTNGDPYYEADETLTLNYRLSTRGREVTLPSSSAQGTILNNDEEYEEDDGDDERERRRRRRYFWWW